jgi:hypothetical protein
VSLPVLAEPSAADRETARNLMKKGDDKFAAKDFAGALKDYQAAHAIMQVPTTGLAVAKAQIEKGLLIEARETLLAVGRLPADPYESTTLSKAREEAAGLARKLADRIPSVTITVEGPSSGLEVQVQVDGETLPPAALGAPRKGDPGPHTISATAQGFATATANVVLKEGANEKVVLKLVPGLSTPPPQVKPVEGGGVIHVTSPAEPGNVFVDGKAVGATPLDVPTTAGTHEVEVQYPGGSHDKRSVDVKKGATAELTFSPSAMDAIGRYRKGVHIGVSAGPAMAAFIDGGVALYGATASFVFNLGITPTFDLRSGLTATWVYDGMEPKWDLTAVIPVLLKVNYTSWFSFSAGLTVGFLEHSGIEFDKTAYHSGYAVGPEWSPFTLSGGDHRQFELGVTQGVHFGSNNFKQFHQAVVFTYLFLD